jgi:hypothetical protein
LKAKSTKAVLFQSICRHTTVTIKKGVDPFYTYPESKPLDLLLSGSLEKQERYKTVLKEASNQLVRLFDGIMSFAELQQSLDESVNSLVDITNL